MRGDGWTKYTGDAHRRPAPRDAGAPHRAGRRAPARCASTWSRCSRATRSRAATNGLRKDLAEKIAALNPGFVRFPGGCLVNTGSMYGYDAASSWQRARVVPVEGHGRPGRDRARRTRNFWGYNQSYGLGYYEYFQFAEDIGAMPLPVVPALVTGCGQNRATDDEALLQRHIQDTLDLIEFANGPVDLDVGQAARRDGPPGAVRPHPPRRSATRRTCPTSSSRSFTQFRAAIEAKYPDITVISNSGPDDQGATFDRLWELNRDGRRRHGRRALLQQPDLVPAEQRPLRLLRPRTARRSSSASTPRRTTSSSTRSPRPRT